MTSLKKKPIALSEFLKAHKSTNASEHTHTRIGSKDLNVFGGSFTITPGDKEEFWQKYYNHVFVQKKQEYLTEKQLTDNGPLLVDVDLRYAADIESRQHTNDHIVDLLSLYIEKINGLLEINNNEDFWIYVMQKPDVNMLEDVTKDGIHLVITLQITRAANIMLRQQILSEIGDVWEDLPIQNKWTDVLDEGITTGSVNWQVFGSRKPGHDAYTLHKAYCCTWNKEDNEWTLDEKLITKIDIAEVLPMISAQSTSGIPTSIHEDYSEEHERLTQQISKTGIKKSKSRNKLKITGAVEVPASVNDIFSHEQLDAAIEAMFEDIRIVDYELKEAHKYVMILPEEYYGAGSYNKWIRVGWALKNTDPKRLLLTWIKFSSQQEGFTFDTIDDLCRRWDEFSYDSREGLKLASIIYWAKTDAPGLYSEVKRETVRYFMEETLNDATEFDIANVLYHMFKDRFVCASIKNNIWYEWKSMCWIENDSGNTLRLHISKQLHDLYTDMTRSTIEQMHKQTNGDDKWVALQKRSNMMSAICTMLKRTTSKNNIMREARELFYDRNFIEKLDTNPYLLCFKNCVVDFKEMTHRKGRPDDYISKCTNVDYIPKQVLLASAQHRQTMAEIESFQSQLFPVEELRRYMWDHQASTCIGTNEGQSLHIYLGSGANGKTMLVELMAMGFGGYKGTVPITLVTQKRNSIGSTSSEVVQLMGTRYAVMQEPSKGDKINEGIMKEITGGDPIQARALFKDSVTFTPQFKLVVCTNTLFDITSNDDGTWRRIRLCDFQSKFLDKPFEDEHRFPKADYPHQFQVDKKLKSKFPRWAPVFMSMLVQRAYETKGDVKDCPMVLASSDQYRAGQDYLAEFARDKIENMEGKSIKKTEVLETFKQWYSTNYGKTPPKGREITDFMDKRYGAYKKGWHNVRIIYEDEDEEEDNFV